jgi:hypothetical protein
MCLAEACKITKRKEKEEEKEEIRGLEATL